MLIRTGTWKALAADAGKIRHAVFVVEQRVPPEIERDSHDAVCVHVVAYNDDGKAVGTGRLLPDGHIGRMAVLPAWRRKGIGARMLQALIGQARDRGFPEVVLSAQAHAQAFYERHGFVAEGPAYLEAGLQHVRMRQRLS
ncbi:MAG TPA: GNAT family N-acetyltransferase [Burkholderiaceae bacterium]|nr:GNAT family N-acetyltransferase [Burkholderiaceae bacterium]